MNLEGSTNINKKNAHSLWSALLSTFLILFILVCIIGIVNQAFKSQPLWLDESMLMDSILTRNFSSLCETPLDFSQNAPVGYIYTVKTLTVIFGDGENILRLFSLVSIIGVIGITFLISKSMYNTEYSLLSTAFVSSIGMLFRYAAEAKPYASDMFFVLVCIYLYELYKQKKINFLSIILSYTIIIWFSFASVFFIAGAMILELTLLIISYSKKKISFKFIIKQTLLSLIVVLSLLLYYLIWLKPSLACMDFYNDYYANDYWKFLSFPLVPKNLDDIKLAFKMLEKIIYPLGNLKIVLSVFSLISIVISIRKRVWSLVSASISIIILLIVSYLGKYPIETRLLLFILPIMIISSFLFISELKVIIYRISISNSLKNFIKNGIVVFFFLAFLVNIISLGITNNGKPIERYGSVDNTHIEYIEDHLEENDKVYVFFYNIPAYLYTTDYKIYAPHFQDEPTEYGNVILGSFFAISNIKEAYAFNWELDMEMMKLDLDMIKSNESVYIIIPKPIVPEGEIITAFLDELNNIGSLTMNYNSNTTNVYHYTRTK